MTIYHHKLSLIDGKEIELDEYKGKVLLIVNVASQCGLTPQYKGLQELYIHYKDRGFEILAFPANEFGAQEPGSNHEIATFCETNYQVTFPLFEKIIVKGKGIHPFYKYLTSKESNPDGFGEIIWNFQKYLIGREGKIIKTFHPKTEPFDSELTDLIEKAL